jgi:hypothetical protein
VEQLHQQFSTQLFFHFEKKKKTNFDLKLPVKLLKYSSYANVLIASKIIGERAFTIFYIRIW